MAVRLPDAPGENVTEMLHVALIASVAGAAGQLSLSAKSPAFAPVTAIPERDSAAVPEFVSVTDCAELVVPVSCEANVRLDFDSVTAGAGVAPVPLTLKLCGLFASLSVI